MNKGAPKKKKERDRIERKERKGKGKEKKGQIRENMARGAPFRCRFRLLMAHLIPKIEKKNKLNFDLGTGFLFKELLIAV